MQLQKNIIAQYGAQIINVVAVFFCSILVARTIGSEGKGNLDLYATMYSFGVIFFGFGFAQAISNFIASMLIEKKKVLSSVLAISVVGALLFFGVVLVLQITNVQSNFLPACMYTTTWKIILSIHVFFILLNTLLSAILFGENKFTTSAIITAIGAFLLFILYILINKQSSVGIVQYKINNALFSFAFASIIVLAVQSVINISVILSLKTGYIFSNVFSVKEIKPLWVFSAWIFITNVIQFFSYKMDVWFLKHYFQNTSIIGIYTLSVSLVQMVWILPKVYHDVLTTETASNTDIKAKIISSAKKMFLISIVFGIVDCVLSFYVVPILFGYEFKEVYSYIFILLFGIIPMSAAMCYSAYFAGIKRIDINFKGTLLGFIFCLLLDYILIPKYNIKGACIATVVSYMVTSAYYYYSMYTLKRNSKE